MLKRASGTFEVKVTPQQAEETSATRPWAGWR